MQDADGKWKQEHDCFLWRETKKKLDLQESGPQPRESIGNKSFSAQVRGGEPGAPVIPRGTPWLGPSDAFVAPILRGAILP